MSDNSSLENADIAELLERVDIEETLKNTDLRELLARTRFEAVFGGFGAAAGREVGAILGRKLGTALGRTEGGPSAETTNDEVSTEETDTEQPATREELEALSYRELQSLARDTDVKGNLPRDEMTEQLAEEFGLNNE